jgi:hypothetical protein
MAEPAARSSEDIRRSIETARGELTRSVNDLQVKVVELTDWRSRVRRNPQPVLIGAAAAGFLLGGGLAGIAGLFRRR